MDRPVAITIRVALDTDDAGEVWGVPRITPRGHRWFPTREKALNYIRACAKNRKNHRNRLIPLDLPWA